MDNSINPEFFNVLPPEFRENIIAQRPELVRAFSQVNPEYQELLRRQVMQQVCNTPVSDPESILARNRQKIRGIMYVDNYNGGIIIITDVVIRPLGRDLVSSVSMIVLNPTGTMAFLDPKNNLMTVGFNHRQNPRNDLMMEYNIMSNRLNCMKINPNFAKHNVIQRLDQFKEFYERYVKSKDIIDYNYLYALIFVYIYLVMNSYVFNILSNAELQKLENLPGNVADIKQDIDYLFDEIRKAILAL